VNGSVSFNAKSIDNQGFGRKEGQTLLFSMSSTEETRRRIVEATRALHQEIGPAATTITAIAERAGVQRLTVYRHFPDQGALVEACSSDWRRDHPLPDPAAWSGLAEPEERLRAALTELYAHFRRGAPMLESVLRDEAEVPELARIMSGWWNWMAEVAGGLAAGWGVDGERQRLVRAAVGHALAFDTWRSLTAEGLDDQEAVELMVRLVVATAEGRPAGR
jgi:AcrR family transcriptional regulator